MAYTKANTPSVARKFKKCTTKKEKILCIINSGKPHSVVCYDMDTNKTSCAPAIGQFSCFLDSNLTTYQTHQKAEKVAKQIYDELINDLKTC